MKHHMWTLALFFFVTLCSFTESRTLTKRQIHGEAAVAGHVGGWQDKAKVEAKWGVKNALIGFVFNPSASLSASSTRSRTSTTKRPTTTEDIVIYKKYETVTAAVPPELFSSGLPLITNLSKRVSDFMLDSGFRLHRLLESMRPFLWKVFGKKGFIIEATTDKPIFTAPEDKPVSNDI